MGVKSEAKYPASDRRRAIRPAPCKPKRMNELNWIKITGKLLNQYFGITPDILVYSALIDIDYLLYLKPFKWLVSNYLIL